MTGKNPDSHILVIDDNRTQLGLYRKFLDKKICQLSTSENTDEARELLGTVLPDLILLDIEMPGTDGLSYLRELKSDVRTRPVPVMMVSSRSDARTIKRSFEYGAADYLRKPYLRDELLQRVRTQIENYRFRREHEARRRFLENRVEEKLREVRDVKYATIFALARLAESRDTETGAHLERIREYVRALSHELSSAPSYSHRIHRGFIDNIYHMSVLHDIGKVGIPDAILLKNGKLTDEEFEIMKTHTTLGGSALDEVCDLNANSAFLRMARDIAYYHHERWDGGGYPRGLKEERIPLAARITAIADVYDALSQRRVYKEAFPTGQVEQIMYSERGEGFDPGVFDAFWRIRHEFRTIKERFQLRPRSDEVKGRESGIQERTSLQYLV